MKTQESGKQYKLYETVVALRDFVLNDFSRTYIKLIRDRVSPSASGKGKESAQLVLRMVMGQAVKAFAPFTPFVCEEIFAEFSSDGESVHGCDYPKAHGAWVDDDLEKQMLVALEVAETASALRQEVGVRLRWPVLSVGVSASKPENKLLVEKTVSNLNGILKSGLNAKAVVHSELGGDKVVKKEFSFGTVFLDSRETPELAEERLMREVSRSIQEARKQAGKEVYQKVVVFIDCEKGLFEKWKKHLEHETTSELQLKKLDSEKKVELGGHTVKISL